MDADPLILQLLEWISSRPRTYAQAMEAWRSTCPRLSIWEDAMTEGLIRVMDDGRTMNDAAVVVTARGRAILDRGSVDQRLHSAGG